MQAAKYALLSIKQFLAMLSAMLNSILIFMKRAMAITLMAKKKVHSLELSTTKEL